MIKLNMYISSVYTKTGFTDFYIIAANIDEADEIAQKYGAVCETNFYSHLSNNWTRNK